MVTPAPGSGRASLSTGARRTDGQAGRCVGRAAVPAVRRTSHPAFPRATTDLDREEPRPEGGDRDRLGVELDGERMAVGPGGAVLIPPGMRHRAAGRMTIRNVVVPPFDPADGWFHWPFSGSRRGRRRPGRESVKPLPSDMIRGKTVC